MSEEKKDSFWDSKDDDFWNKPVVSDDWLKSDNDSFWQKEEPDVKQSENVLEQYQTQNIPERKSRKIEYSHTPQPSEPVLRTKKKHIHTRICLSAIGIMAGILLVLILVGKWNVKAAKQGNAKFNGTEIEAGSKLNLSEGEVMMLDACAVTVVPELDKERFPDGEKMIAFYAILGSEEYQKELKPITPYIGYETDKGMIYKNICNSWDASEYKLENYGFSENDFLYSYTGKGYDSSGFYFFVVPKDVTKVNLYIETYSYKNHYRTVENIYVTELQIIDDRDYVELFRKNRKVVQ